MIQKEPDIDLCRRIGAKILAVCREARSKTTGARSIVCDFRPLSGGQGMMFFLREMEKGRVVRRHCIAGPTEGWEESQDDEAVARWIVEKLLESPEIPEEQEEP